MVDHVAKLSEEANALAELVHERRAMLPDMEIRIKEAVHVRINDNMDHVEGVNSLSDKLTMRAKCEHAGAIAGRIEKLKGAVCETHARATRVRRALKALAENCQDDSECTATIVVENTEMSLNAPPLQKDTSHDKSFSSPPPTRRVAKPLSPTLPAMSPNVTPRTRARRRIANGIRAGVRLSFMR